MAWHMWGNKPITSTQGIASNPSTATLVAELDSTQLNTASYVGSQNGLFQVSWLLGCDTSATWQLETCGSTASTAGIDVLFVKTPTGQTGQFVTQHQLGKDYRIRARVQSTFTASAAATIQAIPLL